ncbi:MAG: sulfite exporter TauE/SafE family protein [Candidatus Krumholzibacteriia bacterium]
MDLVLIALLTLFASGAGTLTGFGTSTIMVPVMVSFFTLSETLLFVGIIHWFGNLWKMALFREGLRWGLIVKFGVPGILATIAGGLLVFQVSETILSRVLGAALLAYVVFITVKTRFKIPEATSTAIAGGTLYGFSAGIFGIGGAVRGAFLSAFDLPKSVYIATAGAIGLAVDSGRLATYWSEGAELGSRLGWGLLLFIPVSFVGAKIAERIVQRIPQERFRLVIAAFLCLVGLKLLLFPPS